MNGSDTSRWSRRSRARGARRPAERLGRAEDGLSASIAASVPARPPAAAIARNGLKGSGGQLSWTSQSVSVEAAEAAAGERRPGSAPCRRRCRCPRSRPARSPSASRNSASIVAFAVTDTSCVRGRSRSRRGPTGRGATQRRTSASSGQLMSPEVAVQEHAVHEQGHRARALLRDSRCSRTASRRVGPPSTVRCPSAQPLRSTTTEACASRERLRALLAAHLHRLAANRHRDDDCHRARSRTGARSGLP